MKFFIDSNIIISSALFPQGKAASVFSYILESHQIVLSSYTLKECEIIFDLNILDLLRNKFNLGG